MKSWIYLLFGAVLIAAAAFGIRHYGIDVVALSGFGSQGKTATHGDEAQRQGGARPSRGPAAVETARAMASRLSDDVSALGTLLSAESAAISPETSGRVAKIFFQDGARVEKGTPLFQ